MIHMTSNELPSLLSRESITAGLQSAAKPVTRTIDGVSYKVHTDKVHLYNKVHWAHPTSSTRNGAGQKVSHPLCGQRSRRFYPSHPVTNDEVTVNCEKCLHIKASS